MVAVPSSQIASNSTAFFTGASADPTSAPVGVNPECGILKAGANGSLGNIANIIVCALSIVFVAGLVVFSSRRKAAVGEFLQFVGQFFSRVQYVVVADVDVPAASGIGIPGPITSYGPSL